MTCSCRLKYLSSSWETYRLCNRLCQGSNSTYLICEKRLKIFSTYLSSFHWWSCWEVLSTGCLRQTWRTIKTPSSVKASPTSSDRRYSGRPGSSTCWLTVWSIHSKQVSSSMMTWPYSTLSPESANLSTEYSNILSKTTISTKTTWHSGSTSSSSKPWSPLRKIHSLPRKQSLSYSPTISSYWIPRLKHRL